MKPASVHVRATLLNWSMHIVAVSPDQNRVSLTLPAQTDHLHLLRLNVAAIAGGSLDIDDIEDAKIAVEELASALVRIEGADPVLHVEVTSDDHRLAVTGRRSLQGRQPVELDEFVPTILDAVVDRYSFGAVDDELRFHFEKDISDR